MPPTASELIHAVKHPLRRRILFAYLDGSVECPSTQELAAATDQRVGQVAYHLKTLASGDILRPVRQGDRPQDPGGDRGWALGVEAEWLRLVLAVWAEADVSG
ncbi:MAG: winged helix-turn-helix domain-containing protein [Solirubrobacterales bacterium]